MKDNTGTPGNEKLKEILEDFNRQPLQFSKEEKIKYTESIETIMPNGLKRWIKIKVSGKGFTIEQAVTDAKTKFDKALNVVLSNPSPTPSITDYNTGPYGAEEQQVDRRIGVLAEDIISCQDLKTLETYKYLLGNNDLLEAYNQRYKELK